MKKGAIWLGAILVVVFFHAMPATADTYEIKGLGVDATAKDAEQAKIAALQSGQEAAFNLLVKRLAVVDDPATLPQFTNAEIAQTIAGITIEEEKTSSVRYIAKLTVRFRAKPVQDLLAQFNIPFADRQAPPILLLAVWQKSPKPVLWDSPNPWREAWSKIDAANSITPILLPLGDLTDIAVASVEDVLALSLQKLGQLKARYGANHVLIARARPNADNTKIDVTISGDSPMGQIEFIQSYQVEAGNVRTAAFTAAREFLAALETKWKQDNQNTARRGGQLLTVAVPFRSLPEWQALRAEIASVEGVGTVDVKSLSAQGALVHIRFAGSPEELAERVGSRGLVLTNVGDAWVLERR